MLCDLAYKSVQRIYHEQHDTSTNNNVNTLVGNSSSVTFHETRSFYDCLHEIQRKYAFQSSLGRERVNSYAWNVESARL